jgi:hypothetical protein
MTESAIQKMKRKFAENPFVPLGLGMSIYGVYMMARSNHLNDKAGFQRAQRFRMTVSFFTIMAIVGGWYYKNRERAHQDWDEYVNRTE